MTSRSEPFKAPPAPVLRIFICTRNRPATLRRCVAALARALRGASLANRARCYLVDDSTIPECSVQVRSLAAEAATGRLPLAIVDRPLQHATGIELTGLGAEPLRAYRSATRPLGERPWDLAGVRNLAFLLAYAYSSDDDIVLFLDDDILLADSFYRGRLVEVDGAALLRQLVSGTPRGQLAASGAAYLGQFDGSVLDHLRFVSEEALALLSRISGSPESETRAESCVSELSRFPSSLPVRLVFDSAADCTEGPGISGGLLATTPASLRSHFLPSCYNEDWIWLTLFEEPGTAVLRVKNQALHAAPASVSVGGAVLDYQNAGETVYRAVRSAVGAGPLSRTPLQECTEMLSEHHFSLAKQSVTRDLLHVLDVQGAVAEAYSRWPADGNARATIQAGLGGAERHINDALARFQALDCAALYGWFRQYLANIAAWRTLLDGARGRVREPGAP